MCSSRHADWYLCPIINLTHPLTFWSQQHWMPCLTLVSIAHAIFLLEHGHMQTDKTHIHNWKTQPQKATGVSNTTVLRFYYHGITIATVHTVVSVYWMQIQPQRQVAANDQMKPNEQNLGHESICIPFAPTINNWYLTNVTQPKSWEVMDGRLQVN